MHMPKAISRIVAPATLALILMFPGASHAKKACVDAGSKCIAHCSQIYVQNSRIEACIDRCMATESKCNHSGGGSAGVQDTGGTGKPPKAGANTSPGGGVATDPKSPPKGAGTRAPVSGGVFNQPLTTGSGGSAPILRASGGKR